MMGWRGCALFCLLLSRVGTAVSRSEVQCSMWPVGPMHPVQAQLERFEAGAGCAAREGGAKETHVISVGKASNKQVTVVLRPLNPSRPVNRPVILVLSSQHAVRWTVENEGLPRNINVLVQVSGNSSAASASVSIRVVQVPFLPRRPQVLLRWVLQRHISISSLTHTVQANRVSLRLGEDPSMPSECRLRSRFLSQNYLASELTEQEVHGCVASSEPADAEVHIIRLWSSGSAQCGSLQVDVSVSLLPPEADSGHHRIVLILCSAVPVNWALVAPEVRGHIRVYSTNSVSLLSSQSPDLTVTRTMTSDLLSTPDLLEWANQKHFSQVTSYTEADLANRFVVKLRAGGRDADVRLSDGWRISLEDEAAHRSREAVHSQCEDGTLSVTVDTRMLQLMVMRVSLRDPGCQAEFNGTHFLLVFPVISCGTEGDVDGESGRVRHTNTVFLWKPSEASHNKSDEMNPLGVQISCEAFPPSPASPVDVTPSSRPEGALWFGPDPAPPWLHGSHISPVLSMELFVTEAFEKRPVGPCVLTAYDRLYVQISVVAGSGDAVDLQACWVSPLSDPQAHSHWLILKQSCPYDPSFTLTERQTPRRQETTDRRAREERQGRAAEDEADGTARGVKDARTDRFRAMTEPEERRRRRGTRDSGGENTHTLGFSFILRPVFNNSIQFLHCSLRLCESGVQTDAGPSGATAHRVCAQGPRIPALTHTPASRQCEDRNLSRPVLVTYPVELLARPAGKLAQTPAERRQTRTLNDAGPVLVIVFVAFVMGLGLMGGLWWIHTHTGRRRAMTQGDGNLETPEPSPAP